jgi:hypothetical protein
MPFGYTVNRTCSIITITGSGTVTMAERYDCVQRLMQDRALDKEHHVLIDVSQVDNSPTVDELTAIVALVERMQAKFGGRVAILNTRIGHVSITDIIALSVYRGRDRVQAFLSESEARAWLTAAA